MISEHNSVLPPIRNIVIHNTIYSIIGRSWAILVGLVLVPYTISHIGIDRFGIWAILSILIGYFALLDFGIGVSYTRFIAESYARKDFREVSRIANSGFVFYLLLCIPIFCTAYFGREIIFSFLKIDLDAYPDLIIAYYGTVIIFLVSTVLSGFTTILQGIQKIDVVNKISIIITIPNFIGTVLFLHAGYKLDGLMWTSAVTSLCGLSISLFYAKRYLPSLSFNPKLFSIPTVKRLLSFGLKLQFAQLADVITFQADKTIVSFFSGIGSVGYYQIGAQIVWRIRDLPLLLIASLLPAASELHALNDRKRLIHIYERGTKYLAVVSIPMFLFLSVTAQIVMRAWLGDGYFASAVVMQILIAGYLFNTVMAVGVVTAASMNQPNHQWYSAVVAIITNLVLVFLLGHYFGLYGIAVSSTVSLIISGIYFLFSFNKYLGIPVVKFIRSTMYYPLLVSLMISSSFAALNILFAKRLFFNDRAANIALFSIEGLIFAAIYGMIIWSSTYFDSVDKELMTNNYLLSTLRRRNSSKR
jgi:O-antigen/teichoic acid export membrane protein